MPACTTAGMPTLEATEALMKLANRKALRNTAVVELLSIQATIRRRRRASDNTIVLHHRRRRLARPRLATPHNTPGHSAAKAQKTFRHQAERAGATLDCTMALAAGLRATGEPSARPAPAGTSNTDERSAGLPHQLRAIHHGESPPRSVRVRGVCRSRPGRNPMSVGALGFLDRMDTLNSAPRMSTC